MFYSFSFDTDTHTHSCMYIYKMGEKGERLRKKGCATHKMDLGLCFYEHTIKE